MIELMEDEKIIFKRKDSNNKSISTKDIVDKYIKGEIRIVTEQARYPLTSIIEIVESRQYNINPSYQRRNKWDVIKKSRLIESFIINVPVPPIFLYETEYAKYELMDGLQRLTSIYEFYKNQFKLEGLEEWPELNGYTYSKLPLQVRNGIDRRYISSIILLYETAKDEVQAKFMKKLVFERLNSGGDTLNPQEIRNAVYDGKMNKLCMKLALNKKFCIMWKIPEPDKSEIEQGITSQKRLNNENVKQMQDIELVLRFFAFRHIGNVKEIPSFEKFFNIFLEAANKFSDEMIKFYEELFLDTLELVYSLFNENAFKLFRKRKNNWILYNRPTKVVYDPIMLALSQFIERKEQLLSNREDIKRDIIEFYKCNYESFEGRNTNRNDIEKRIKLYIEFFNNYIGE
ncbi:DUF262 domain-containing protein [Clostridium botulinum]|nr:DUF262 domain-containing protein [Clostridium botulinum]